MHLLGYFHGHDPGAGLLADGKVVAFVEEERLLRFKHAEGLFPIRSIRACLELAGLGLGDLDGFVYGWDAPRYADAGENGMEAFYAGVNRRHPPDPGTLGWQRGTLSWFDPRRLRGDLEHHLMRQFGVSKGSVPELLFHPHHASHAAASYYFSPFEEALVLCVDGSGDSDCTSVWRARGLTLEPLHRISIPHSLGWFYAAMTEYLGFGAYDGEYKVMGLAAYGRPDERLRAALAEVLSPGPLGFDYRLDPTLIHHGAHTYSHRFTDRLVEVLGVPPRLGEAPLEPLHEDLAYETQRALEETVLRLVEHFRRETGLRRLAIGGGVGLNVKMNSRLHGSGLFDEIYPFPIPSDTASGLGGAAAIHVERTGRRPQPVRELYWGPEFGDVEIERRLRACGLAFSRPPDIAVETAALLARGKVVGWFQGRMEAGPRALGARSILADPRTSEGRDRVNRAIKFREYWRPFCPSLTEEAATEFLERGEAAPFMVLAFEATERARREAPGVVHVDGTVRAQTVNRETNPVFHRLLEAFEAATGVPVVLNTSFNVKGEAIVCTPRDALRTFWSTGIDALAIGPFLVEKPADPRSPEEEEAK